MDSYLDIARKVLRASRRPMTAKGILDAAYKAKIVPPHLYGKTQQKTLQARISEDILSRKNNSLFYRTEPGVFFLSELFSDPNIPNKYKEKFPARRRSRDLHKDPSLAIDENFFQEIGVNFVHDWKNFIQKAEENDALRYVDCNRHRIEGNNLIVWTFSIVRRGSEVLSYRVGRYRDDRDTFANKRTIGFPGIISFFDSTLFSDGDYGASENALASILFDLDISANTIVDQRIPPPKPKLALQVPREEDGNILLLVMEWPCPKWFEPTTRRLSLNDPCWIDIRVLPNNLSDFEPWTLATLEAFHKVGG